MAEVLKEKIDLILNYLKKIKHITNHHIVVNHLMVIKSIKIKHRIVIKNMEISLMVINHLMVRKNHTLINLLKVIIKNHTAKILLVKIVSLHSQEIHRINQKIITQIAQNLTLSHIIILQIDHNIALKVGEILLIGHLRLNMRIMLNLFQNRVNILNRMDGMLKSIDPQKILT